MQHQKLSPRILKPLQHQPHQQGQQLLQQQPLVPQLLMGPLGEALDSTENRAPTIHDFDQKRNDNSYFSPEVHDDGDGGGREIVGQDGHNTKSSPRLPHYSSTHSLPYHPPYPAPPPPPPPAAAHANHHYHQHS